MARLLVLSLLLCSISALVPPPNVVVTPDFTFARNHLQLTSASSRVNTVVVERAAAIPQEFFDDVLTPAQMNVALPDPIGDADGTQQLVRSAVVASLCGLTETHAGALSMHIAELCTEFARCCAGEGSLPRAVRAQLVVSAQNDLKNAQRCPRYHTDQVPVRLVATLCGSGTQVLPTTSVDRGASPLRDDTVPYDATPGDVLMLVGASSAGGAQRAAVHRSPPPPSTRVSGGSRVVLVVDVDEDPPPPSSATDTPIGGFAKHLRRLLVA